MSTVADQATVRTDCEERSVANAAPICHTTGRRKRAVARVRIRPGQGAITVNGHKFEEYFSSATHRMIVTEPLRLTETTESWAIDVTIDGGGVSGRPAPSASGSPGRCASSTPSCGPRSRRPGSSPVTRGRRSRRSTA